MRFWRIGRSIRARVTLAVAGVALVAALSFALYFPPRMESMARHSMSSKASGVAEMLAYNLTVPLEFKDVRGVKETLVSVTRDPQFVGVQVLDESGRTLAGNMVGVPAGIIQSGLKVNDLGSAIM